jgi:hypothetical protein
MLLIKLSTDDSKKICVLNLMPRKMLESISKTKILPLILPLEIKKPL